MTNGSKVGALDLAPIDNEQFDGYGKRRLKAAIVLVLLWSSTLALHVLTWGHWIVYGLTALTGLHLFKLLLTPPENPLEDLLENDAEAMLEAEQWPHVSILVAAKNEVAVIRPLVERLMQLDYPSQQYDLWIVDDHSTDGTAELLDALASQYEALHVVHRSQDATGGKSGALNQVWQRTHGRLLVVFDADAQVPSNFLRRVVPLFQQPEVGAVQVRKAIANANTNVWTEGQSAEMAFDAYCQTKRFAGGGIGELRGNGQFVRREALEQCGGWNEETITDDLDLTFRLHLNGWTIPVTLFPAVEEEGVIRGISLWHQRNRWAEGGYQRYLDYWRFLTPSRLGLTKALDMSVFWLIQYALPTVALPDFAISVVRYRPPMFAPLSGLVVLFSMIGMFQGIRRTQALPIWIAGLHTLRGMVYMMHWFFVVSLVTLRISIRPKRLKWVKTSHLGKQASTVVETTSCSKN